MFSRARGWHSGAGTCLARGQAQFKSLTPQMVSTRSDPLAQQAVVQNNPQNVSTPLGASSVKAAGGCWRSPWHSPETTGGGGVRGGPTAQLLWGPRCSCGNLAERSTSSATASPCLAQGQRASLGRPGNQLRVSDPPAQPCLCLRAQRKELRQLLPSPDSPCHLCHLLARARRTSPQTLVPAAPPHTRLVTLSLWPPRATSSWPHYALVPHVAGTVHVLGARSSRTATDGHVHGQKQAVAHMRCWSTGGVYGNNEVSMIKNYFWLWAILGTAQGSLLVVPGRAAWVRHGQGEHRGPGMLSLPTLSLSLLGLSL